MPVSSFLINITSEQPERLTKFYADVVGLPRNPDMASRPSWRPTPFLIDGHSDVHGPAKEPQRALLDFFVDDLRQRNG